MSTGSDLCDPQQTIECDDGSSNDLTVSSPFEFKDGSVPFITKSNSGQMSPVRARTMKEYDQQIAELQKENFNLKLRIYFLEERMKTDWDIDSDSVLKENIELKVEVESLKKDLIGRQELLKKASSALTSQSMNYQVELQQAKDSGIAEGQRLASKELDTLKSCIEGLQKELNAKREQLESLHLHSRDAEVKLNDLLAINRQMDTRWRQAESDRKVLEARLEMLAAAEKETAEAENNGTASRDTADEVVRKDRLIEQLRCALKAKDVIIQQVEEEKREAIQETTSEYQKQITQLQAKIQDHGIVEAMDSVSSVGKSRATIKSLEKSGRVTCDAETQTAEQTKLTADLNEDRVLALSQFQAENEKLKKQIGRREKEVVQLIDQLDMADQSLKQKDRQLKELSDTFHQDKQRNAGKILELDAHYKVLFDDAHRHAANQDEIISRLTQRLKHKDEQMEKLLQLSDQHDVTHMHTKITEIIREIQKENTVGGHGEVVNGNDLIFKTKMNDLERELDAKTAELEAVRNELSSLHQTISNIERKLAGELPSRMVQQQQSGFEEMENPLQFDGSGRGNVIKQLLDILALRDRQCQGALNSGSMSGDPEIMSSSEIKRLSGSHGPKSSRLNEIPSSDAKFEEKLHLTEANHQRESPAKDPSGRSGSCDLPSVVDKSFQMDEALSSCDREELFRLRTEVELLRQMVNKAMAEQLQSRQNELVSQKPGKVERLSPSALTTNAIMDGSGQTRLLHSPDGRHSAKTFAAHLNGHLTAESMQELGDPLPRELRLLSPRSNISYLSVESSKRWTMDMDDDEMENPMSSGMLPASQMKIFRLLIPDESTLSSRSPDQLREIIRTFAKAVHDPGAVWDGSQCASPSSIISLQTLEQQSNLLENHTDQSLMEFSLRRKQLEKRLEEKEGVISDVSGKLEEMSVALGQNRRELDIAMKKNNELLLRLDEASRQLQRSQDTVVALEAELRRVGEELKSTERANDLLKEQIQLNARVDNSSLVFNPELIVRLSKEVDRMKKERASMEKELDRKTADSDHRPLGPAPVVQKFDRSTSTENLLNSEPSSHIRHVEGDAGAANNCGKVDHQNSYSAYKSEHDAFDGSAFTGHSAGDGKNDLVSGLTEEFNGRLSEGRKSYGGTKEARRSLIPVSLKSTKSLSLDEETDMCNRVKCVQLETRLMIMQSRIEDQSRQIAHYRDLLKEVDRARTPDARRLSEPGVPTLSADRTRSISEQGASGKAAVCRTKSNSDSPTMVHANSPDNSSWQKERNGECVASKVLKEGGKDFEQSPSDKAKAFGSTQPTNALSTPFDVTRASNLQEFVRLKSEVRRLKALLDTRDGSRLNDTVQMNADGTFCLPEVSFSPGRSIPPPPPSSQPGSEAEQLKHRLVETQNYDTELLQYHLAKSHQNYDLLRRRLEELLEYLEKQLKMTDSSLQSSALHTKLSDTRLLIHNLSQSFNSSRDSSIRMSLPGHLMRPDLDSTSMIGLADEEYVLSTTGRQSLYDASIRKDYTLSEEPSEMELERHTLRQHVALLEHECGVLEERMHRKEVELEQRLHQKQLELKSVIAEAADLRSEAAGLWMDVESLKTGLGEEKETNCALKSELMELKQSNQSLQETLEILRQKMEEVSQERNELVDENHQLQLALADHETKVSDLEREFVESEARRVDELRHSKENHLRQMADLELERNTLLTKIHMLTSEIQALKIEVVRERDRADTAEVAGKSCLEKLEDKDALIQKLKELVKENQKMAEELRVELHRVNEDVQQKKLTIRRLSQKCQELQNSFHRLKPDSLSEDTALPVNQPHAQDKEVGFNIKESLLEKINDDDHSSPPVSGVHSGKMSQQFGDKCSSDMKNQRQSGFVDRKPTLTSHEANTSDHQPTISSGMVVDCEKNLGGVVVADAGDETTGLPRKSRRGFDHRDGDVDLRSRLKAAEEMVAILKAELRIFRRVNESGSSAASEDDLRVKEHLEEIKLLRQHLEQSLKKNDELRDNLLHQLRHAGSTGEDRISGLQFTEMSESTQLTRDIDTAQKEVSVQKTRLNRLQSELKEQITQLESLETEKRTVQKKIDASKIKLESAQAETQRLKMSLDENIEVSRAMKLELKLMGEVKIDDKENKLALPLNNPLQGSKSPSSRLQLTDLLVEMRQLRMQLEKAVENNDVLRRDLERASNNKIELLSEDENIHSRTEFLSVPRTDRRTKSSLNGVDGSQTPWTSASLASTRHSSDVYRKDLGNGSALAENQSLYAVADKEVFESLKLEVLRNQRAVGQLEKSIQAIHAEVIEDERKQDLCGLIQEMRSVVTEQVRLMALFWMLDLLRPDPNASYTAKAVEAQLLRKQLSDLKERYSRAKHAMKGAQQRLEANNRKKEEFFALQRSRKDQAIQEQITKTHQVLVQSRRNLESFHNQCGDQSS